MIYTDEKRIRGVSAMRVSQIVCVAAVGMIRHRVRFGHSASRERSAAECLKVTMMC